MIRVLGLEAHLVRGRGLVFERGRGRNCWIWVGEIRTSWSHFSCYIRVCTRAVNN